LLCLDRECWELPDGLSAWRPRPIVISEMKR
jgi:hypothetical protein